MSDRRNVITDCTLWLDKTHCFGKLKEYEPPEIESKVAECKETDSLGEYELPILKVAKISSKGVLNSFYSEIFSKIANPSSLLNMTLYGNIMEYQNEAIVRHVPAKVVMRAFCKKFKIICDFKAHEVADYPMEFNHSMVALYVDNKEKFYIDLPNRIYRVGGIDLLAQVNANLGLT